MLTFLITNRKFQGRVKEHDEQMEIEIIGPPVKVLFFNYTIDR